MTNTPGEQSPTQQLAAIVAQLADIVCDHALGGHHPFYTDVCRLQWAAEEIASGSSE